MLGKVIGALVGREIDRRDGELVQGVRYRGGGATTHSLVMRGRSGTIRSITSEHQLAKLKTYASIDFEH